MGVSSVYVMAVEHMRVVACVDYDNVRLIRERTLSDVENNLDEILDQLVKCLLAAPLHVSEVDVRLYGGWVTEDGIFSRNAEWAFGAVTRATGRRRGIRIITKVIISPACRPSEMLIGTVRLRQRNISQKMVDTLLTVDALHLATETYEGIFLLSDDDDIVPCAVALGVSRSKLCTLVRLRPPGVGLNDDMLCRSGVRLDVLRTP